MAAESRVNFIFLLKWIQHESQEPKEKQKLFATPSAEHAASVVLTEESEILALCFLQFLEK